MKVHSEGRAHFNAAVIMAFANALGGKATHFISPVPETTCGDCSGSGKTSHWKGEGEFKNREHCQYACKTCDGKGKIPTHAGMILLWHEDKIGNVTASPLPFPLTAESASDFLWHYLDTAEFGQQPDHDGDNGRGFIVSTGDFWGHTCESFYAFIGVYPDWQMYGK